MPSPVDFVSMGLVGTFALLYLSFGGYVVYTQLTLGKGTRDLFNQYVKELDMEDKTKMYLINMPAVVTVNLDNETSSMLYIRAFSLDEIISTYFFMHNIKKRNYYYSEDKKIGHDSIFVKFDGSKVELIISIYKHDYRRKPHVTRSFFFDISQDNFNILEKTLKQNSINKANTIPSVTSEEDRTLLGNPEEDQIPLLHSDQEGETVILGGTRAHRRRRVKRKSLTHKKVVVKRS